MKNLTIRYKLHLIILFFLFSCSLENKSLKLNAVINKNWVLQNEISCEKVKNDSIEAKHSKYLGSLAWGYAFGNSNIKKEEFACRFENGVYTLKDEKDKTWKSNKFRAINDTIFLDNDEVDYVKQSIYKMYISSVSEDTLKFRINILGDYGCVEYTLKRKR
jgi:hypothetical protein